jgi:ribonuclease R
MIKIGNIYEGELRMNSSGSAYMVSDELPKDIYIHKSNTGKALHLDNIEIEIVKGKDNKFEGKVLEVLERFKTQFVGVIEISEKYAFFIPDSNKMSVDIFIPLKKLRGAKHKQKVVCELTEWKGNAKSPNGKIIEVLGDAGDNDVEIHAILHEYGLPYEFDKEVEDEANKIPLTISDDEITKRLDMRNILTFTIDPDTAKDFDDALSVEWVNGQIKVGIHIADVSHYIRPNTDLDTEAYNRGTSVYLVDRVVPMLPERLSNGVCSLRPNEDKLCFSAVFTLDNKGKVIDEWFGRTVIHSDHRFTYEEAQTIIEWDKSSGPLTLNEGIEITDDRMWRDAKFFREITDAIQVLDKIAKEMRKSRESVDFNSTEVKFKLDEDNNPVDIIFKIQKDANKLIEEFMLLANKRVAQLLNKKGVAIPNRVHKKPDPTKLEKLKDFIVQFGYKLDITDSDRLKKSLTDLTKEVRGTAEENIINSLVIRSMQKAAYSTDNIGHYGLGFTDYGHFTSPIRRYPDIILHRILDRILKGKEPQKKGKIEHKCQYLSTREVTAQKASRDSIKYMQCLYMVDKIGKVYTGVVNSIQTYGLFVEIPETGSEGLIRISDISGDTFQVDMDNYCVKGFNTGEIIRLGDEVTIVVKSVDIEKKNINLTLIKL